MNHKGKVKRREQRETHHQERLAVVGAWLSEIRVVSGSYCRSF